MNLKCGHDNTSIGHLYQATDGQMEKGELGADEAGSYWVSSDIQMVLFTNRSICARCNGYSMQLGVAYACMTVYSMSVACDCIHSCGLPSAFL